MKNIINFLFEKDGGLKIIISLFACIILFLICAVTDNDLFFWLSTPFLAYLIMFGLVSLIYAWIIIPTKFLINKFKKK